MAPGDTAIVELANGVFVRLHEGLTNAGILVGDDAVLVIDSLRVPSFARDLIDDVRRLSDKPIRYLVDTHAHWDHAWGNEEFTDSIIIGHENCRREMEEYGERWRETLIDRGTEWTDELKTVNITPPALTFDGKLELHFGGRRVDLLYLGRAHTSGDLFVHLPDDGLLFTGDVAQDGGVPFMGDGFIRDWIDTDARLLDLDFERFAPGHGPIGEKPAVAEAREFVAQLLAATERAHGDGQDEATATDSVTTALKDRFGRWRSFDRLPECVSRTYREVARR